MKPHAVDAILVNASINTVDPRLRIAGAMTFRDGRIVAVGSEDELKAAFVAGKTIDAGGASVYPGFIDPHSHLFNYGYMLQRASLFGTSSWKDVVARLAVYRPADASPWILGRGWDQNDWEDKALPSNELLDAAFPDTPVLLTRVDGHAAVANSAALRLAGITADSRAEGGEFVKRDGRLTGLLVDNALDAMRKALPKVTPAIMADALALAQGDCFAAGLTSVSDAGTVAAGVEALEKAHADGTLSLRVYAMLRPTAENAERYIRKGPLERERLTTRAIKLFADGALGSRGAFLLGDYSDDPGNRGLQIESPAEIDSGCALAFANGYQVCTHCIGDAAVRLTLDIYAKYLKPGNDLRWRIEHAQIVDPSDLPRFGEMGVIPSIQSTHATSDFIWAPERLGSRMECAYRYRSLLEQNGWLPNSSDFPIENVNPLYGFHAAVARKNRDGFPEGGFRMEEALSRQEALKAMTIWAAKANFEDGTRGSLEAGKWADFVLLDRDIMNAPEEELRNVRVLATYVGGKAVFEAG